MQSMMRFITDSRIQISITRKILARLQIFEKTIPEPPPKHEANNGLANLPRRMLGPEGVVSSSSTGQIL